MKRPIDLTLRAALFVVIAWPIVRAVVGAWREWK